MRKDRLGESFVSIRCLDLSLYRIIHNLHRIEKKFTYENFALLLAAVMEIASPCRTRKTENDIVGR